MLRCTHGPCKNSARRRVRSLRRGERRGFRAPRAFRIRGRVTLPARENQQHSHTCTRLVALASYTPFGRTHTHTLTHMTDLQVVVDHDVDIERGAQNQLSRICYLIACRRISTSTRAYIQTHNYRTSLTHSTPTRHIHTAQHTNTHTTQHRHTHNSPLTKNVNTFSTSTALRLKREASKTYQRSRRSLHEPSPPSKRTSL